MRLKLATISCALLALLASSARPPTADGFEIGFADALFSGGRSGEWASRVAASGADSIRVNLYWSSVARDEPADPRDPDDPAYDFTAIDRAVRSANENGLGVLMTVLSAPRYAEGPKRPGFDEAPAGTWRPDPLVFGDFAHALAERYSGLHPDPIGDGTLPEVDLYSVWNEQNTTAYLTPQFVDGENESAATYVGLLDSFYEEVKAVNPEAVISTGGTAPFGDPGGSRRTSPLAFWRRVMCLTPSLERADACGSEQRAEFDVLAHNPISYLSSPRTPAGSPDDVTIADFGELAHVLRAAEDLGTVDPEGPHLLIAPEVWWETNPPDRSGISLHLQARYTALGLYLLWKKGADGVWFLQFRDAPRRPREPKLRSYQTGIYTYEERRKPAYRAIEFPFVTDRTDGHRLLAWGRAPASGRLRIEVKRHGSDWHRVASLSVVGGEIFTRKLRLSGRARLRARVGGERSLVWSQAGA